MNIGAAEAAATVPADVFKNLRLPITRRFFTEKPPSKKGVA
jgi:hypothetical protein